MLKLKELYQEDIDSKTDPWIVKLDARGLQHCKPLEPGKTSSLDRQRDRSLLT